MRTDIVVMLLGIYIFAIGLVAMTKTASFLLLYLSGALGGVTVWLGWLMGKQIRTVRGFLIMWLALTATVSAAGFFGNVAADALPGLWSVLTFGSVTVLSLATLGAVLRTRQTFGPGRQSYIGNDKVKGAA